MPTEPDAVPPTARLRRHRWPWTRVMMFLYCVASVFVGIVGIVDHPEDPPALGVGGIHLFSTVLMVFGILGAIGIFRSLQAVVISIWAIAAATFFHGIATLADGATQIGLRLIIAPLMMVPMVWSWKQWLVLVKQVKPADRPRRGGS